MESGGIVIDFISRRTLAGSLHEGPRSVTRIASELADRQGSTCGSIASAKPLQISLEDLAGLGDETIVRLSALAHHGVLTPASAARLALRHAREVSGFVADPSVRPAAGDGGRRICLTLSGDPFRSYALHLQGRNEWIGFAPATGLERLMEVCPPQLGPICLLIGCDAQRRTRVRFLLQRDWRRHVSSVGFERRSRACQHLLVLGGFPYRGPARSVVIMHLERAIRQGGNTQLAALRTRRRLIPGTAPDAVRIANNLLTLIELVFPGLADAGCEIEERRS